MGSFYPKIRFISAHTTTPVSRGVRTDVSVHFTLLVSFHIVRRVVEQGKWNIEKMQVQRAVVQVQPLSVSIVLRLSSDA